MKHKKTTLKPLNRLSSARLAAAFLLAAACGASAQSSLEWWPGPTPPDLRAELMKKGFSGLPDENARKAIYAAAPDKPLVPPAKPRKVLVWGKLWTHMGNGYGQEAMIILGEKTGAFEAVGTDDPLMLLPESLEQFDAIFWNSLHDGYPFRPIGWDKWPKDRLDEALRLEEQVKQSVLDFVMEHGKGVAGMEGSIAACAGWDEYAEMMGARMSAHFVADMVFKPEEPDHPLLSCFEGKNFTIKTQGYWPAGPFSREAVRVLLSLDLTAMPNPAPEGSWQRDNMILVNKQLGIEGRDDDFPVSWVRRHGKGRVFFATLGVWQADYSNPMVLRYLLAAIQFAAGDLKCETIPRGWGMTEDNIDLDAMAKRVKAAIPHDRAAILRTLPSYAGEKCVPLLIDALKDEDPKVRVAALQSLSRVGDTSAIPAVTAAFADKDPKARQAAVLALGKVGDDSVLQLLAEAACAVDVEMRDAARKSLTRLKGDGVEQAMIESASDEDEAAEVRCEMMRALAGRGAAQAAPKLLEIARGDDPDARMAALQALAKVGGKAEIPALIELTMSAKNTDEQAAAEALAAAALNAGRPDAELDMLGAAFDKADGAGRAGLLKAVARIGRQKDLGTVRGALKDKDASVAEAALQALAWWSDPGPMDELLALAKESDNENMRASALSGHIRMIGMKQSAGLGADEALALYTAAIDLAERDEERALALQGLAKTPDVKVLEFLQGYIEELAAFGDENLAPLAELAYVDVAIALRKTHPKEAKAALEQFCGSSKNKELVERAATVVQEIK